MSKPTEEAGEWEFYPCRVDDAPATILLNLAYRGGGREGRDTLYYVGFQILEPGAHGMGDAADAERLWALEDGVTKAAAAAGLTYVGRLRNRGDWQLTFYGKAGNEAALEELVTRALSGNERGYRLGSKADAK